MTHDDRRPLLRTDEEIFQAGWDRAAREAPPLTQSQIDRLVVLHRPYLVPDSNTRRSA